MPSHLASAVEDRFQELLIDLAHESEVHLALVAGSIIEGRPRDRQHLALPQLSDLCVKIADLFLVDLYPLTAATL